MNMLKRIVWLLAWAFSVVGLFAFIAACAESGGGSKPPEDDGTLVGGAGGGCIDCADGAVTEQGADIANDITGAYLSLPPGTEGASQSLYFEVPGETEYSQAYTLEVEVSNWWGLWLNAATDKYLAVVYHASNADGDYEFGLFPEDNIVVEERGGARYARFSAYRPGNYQLAWIVKKVERAISRVTEIKPMKHTEVIAAPQPVVGEVGSSFDEGIITFDAEIDREIEGMICLVSVYRDGEWAGVGDGAGGTSFTFIPSEAGTYTATYRCWGDGIRPTEVSAESVDAAVAANEVVETSTDDVTNAVGGGTDGNPAPELLFHLSSLMPDNGMHLDHWPDTVGGSHVFAGHGCEGDIGGSIPGAPIQPPYRSVNTAQKPYASFNTENCLASEPALSAPLMQAAHEEFTMIAYVTVNGWQGEVAPEGGPIVCLGASPEGCAHSLRVMPDRSIAAVSSYPDPNTNQSSVVASPVVSEEVPLMLVYSKSLSGAMTLQVGTDSYSGNTDITMPPLDPHMGIMIGGNPFMSIDRGLKYYFGGKIMEVMIFDKAMTQTQLGAIKGVLEANWPGGTN